MKIYKLFHLLSNAVTSRRDKSILFSRIAVSSSSRDFTTCSKILFPHKEEVSKSKFSDTNSTLEFVEEKKKEVETKRQTYLSQSDVDEKRFDTKKYADDLEADFNEMSKEKALEDSKFRQFLLSDNDYKQNKNYESNFSLSFLCLSAS